MSKGGTSLTRWVTNITSRGLGAPDECNNGVLKVDVFGRSISKNVDVGRGRGSRECQLESWLYERGSLNEAT